MRNFDCYFYLNLSVSEMVLDLLASGPSTFDVAVGPPQQL